MDAVVVDFFQPVFRSDKGRVGCSQATVEEEGFAFADIFLEPFQASIDFFPVVCMDAFDLALVTNHFVWWKPFLGQPDIGRPRPGENPGTQRMAAGKIICFAVDLGAISGFLEVNQIGRVIFFDAFVIIPAFNFVGVFSTPSTGT